MTSDPEVAREIHQRTEQLAYQIWEWGGRQPNVALDSWLAAERIVFSALAAAHRTYVTKTVGREIENNVRQLSYQMWEATAQQYGIALDTWVAAQDLMFSAVGALGRIVQRFARHSSDNTVKIRAEENSAVHGENPMLAMIRAMETYDPHHLLTELGAFDPSRWAWIPPPMNDFLPLAGADAAQSAERAERMFQKAIDPAPPPPVLVTISGEAPKQAEKGKIALIDFCIERAEDARPLSGARVDVHIVETEKIRVFVSTHGVEAEILGPRSMEVHPPAPGRPIQDAFEIRALTTGNLDVAIHFRQGGTELARLAFKIQVVEGGGVSAERRGARIAAHPRDLADDEVVTLYIEERPELGGGLSYRYWLTAINLGLHHESSTPHALKDRGGGVIGSTIAYVDWIYKELTRELISRSDAESLSRKIRDIGNDMALELFDPSFVRTLWPHRDRIRAIDVISWEPFIPWELIRFRHPDTDERDERYLCEYGLVRELQNQPVIRDLHLHDWSFLKAEYPEGDNRAIGEEVAFFTATLPARGIQPTRIEADEEAVRSALEDGAFDVLHIACHGRSEHDEIENSELILGESPAAPGQPPRPIIIKPNAVRSDARLKARRPIVFLNACESGRIGPSLTTWSGWPTVFLERGAGVFVGTSWPVHDKPSRVFSETFYDSLLSGSTLADAAISARTSTKNLGDASWLAYKIFGYPLARWVSEGP